MPSFSDSDGDTVTISFVGLPSFVSYSNGKLMISPGADNAGVYVVQAKLSDGINPAALTVFTINIAAA